MVNFTNSREFTVSVTNSRSEMFRYICRKKSAEKDKKKMGYFFIGRCGWINMRISPVSMSPVKMDESKYSVKIGRAHV